MARVILLFKTDHDMAKGILKKDSNAQRAFYEKYAAKFLGICCRYIKDNMAAEDVMVESMMRIFDKTVGFDFKGSYEGWCKRVVVNQALGYLRSKKMLIQDLENVVLESGQSFEGNLEADDLLKLIQDLPDGYRTVFNLYAIEGYSHAEIGELLGISEGTSKSQLSRARGVLQEQLKKNELHTTLNF